MMTSRSGMAWCCARLTPTEPWRRSAGRGRLVDDGRWARFCARKEAGRRNGGGWRNGASRQARRSQRARLVSRETTSAELRRPALRAEAETSPTGIRGPLPLWIPPDRSWNRWWMEQVEGLKYEGIRQQAAIDEMRRLENRCSRSYGLYGHHQLAQGSAGEARVRVNPRNRLPRISGSASCRCVGC